VVNLTVNYHRIDQIVDEVFDLMDSSMIEDLFESFRLSNPVPKLDRRFTEIINSIESFSSMELAVYLRTSSSRRAVSSNWNQLLLLAVDRSKSRDEPFEDIFYGLI
jgi:hypothetical protein